MKIWAVSILIFLVHVLFVHGSVVFLNADVAPDGAIESNSSVSIRYFNFSVDDDTFKFNMSYGDSVHKTIFGLCRKHLSEIECEKVEDILSLSMYGSQYTPTCPLCGLVEYVGSRATVIELILRHFNYKRYLEIGTFDNRLFDQVKTFVDFAVGVDPEQGGTHRMTSDAFFAQNKDSFELIFVDGLHEANQVFRDIQNSLRFLAPNGTIILHDSNPRGDESASAFPRVPDVHHWTGDVWKAIVACRMDPAIEVVLVDIDFGVAIIRKRPNRHPLSADWRAFLSVNPISMLTHSHLVQSRYDLMRFMSVGEIKGWLQEEW